MRHYILLLTLFLTGCGEHLAALPTLKPYQPDIQQGNVVTPKMMLQLRPGMTKSQVRFVMGTPLLVDPFHADRWDYFYQVRREGRIIDRRRIMLEFENDALKHVRGDVIPAGSDPSVVTVEPLSTDTRSSAPQPKNDEKGWLDTLKFWEDDDKPAPRQNPATEPKTAPAIVAPALVPAPENTAPASSLPEIAPQSVPDSLPPLTEEVPAPAKEAVQPAEQTVPAQPVVKPRPVAPVAAPPKTAPVEKQAIKEAPVAQKNTQPTAEASKTNSPLSKTPPPPPADLPPEDAPEFFEKMLEKIGF